MTKQEIASSLRKAAGGAEFVTSRQLQIYTGRGKEAVRRMFYGLDKVNGTLYFIPDVAERMMQSIQ